MLDQRTHIQTPPDPLRPFTAEEAVAITDHHLFFPGRPLGIPRESWSQRREQAIQEVRKAAQWLGFCIPFSQETGDPVAMACDTVTQQAAAHSSIEKRLLEDEAVLAVRAEIGFFLAIRWVLGSHPQFSTFLQFVNEKEEKAFGIRNMRRFPDLTDRIFEIVRDTGNREPNTTRWKAVTDFFLEQAGLKRLTKKHTQTDSLSCDVDTRCAQITAELGVIKDTSSSIRTRLAAIKTQPESGRYKANFREPWDAIANAYFRCTIAMGAVARLWSEELKLDPGSIPEMPRFTFAYLARKPASSPERISIAEGRLSDIETWVAALEARMDDIRQVRLGRRVFVTRNLRYLRQELQRVSYHLHKAVEATEKMPIQELPPKEEPKPNPAPPLPPENPTTEPVPTSKAAKPPRQLGTQKPLPPSPQLARLPQDFIGIPTAENLMHMLAGGSMELVMDTALLSSHWQQELMKHGFRPNGKRLRALEARPAADKRGIELRDNEERRVIILPIAGNIDGLQLYLDMSGD